MKTIGADIWFGKSKNIYFRDSYNLTNLAWVVGLSYWNDFTKDPNGFIKKLSCITDAQIDAYVKNLLQKNKENILNKRKEIGLMKADVPNLKKTLKSKRDEVRKIVKGNHKVSESSV